MFSYNFCFLRDIDTYLYTELCEGEENILVDPYKASTNIRHSLEHLVHLIMTNKVNEQDINNQLNFQRQKWEARNDRQLVWKPDLNTKIRIIKDAKRYRIGSNTKLFPDYANKSVVDCGFGIPDTRPGNESKSDVVNYLRQFGNNGPHTPDADDMPVLPTTNNAIIAFQCIHQLLLDYYQQVLRKKKIKVGKYDLDKIPINKYFIDSTYIPLDSAWSKCTKEYGCHFYEGNNDLIKHYAILREYKEEDYSNDNLFVTRNIDIYGNIKSVSATNNVSMNEIRCISQDGNGSYFIAYEFARTPYRLNNETFKRFSFSIKDRMEICSKLINDIYKLHFANPPIYHRDLSFDSIALCNFSENESEWVPYIIKFNFAKYKDGQVGTVVENLIAADYRMYEDEKAPARLNKYRIDVIDKDTEWDKVDIYSLGNLLVDILLLNIHAKKIGQKNFEDIAEMLFIKPDSPTITMLKRMLSEDIYERPDIGEVKAVFDKEAERWI